MPWKEHCEKSARRRFIEEVRFGLYSVCELCGRYEISRKTAYKWLKRFFEGGVEALGNRSRRPRKLRGSTLGPAWRQRILGLKKRHPHWGAKKLRARLGVVFADQKVPSCSTIQRLLRKERLIWCVRRVDVYVGHCGCKPAGSKPGKVTMSGAWTTKVGLGPATAKLVTC
jgi:transposase